MYVRKYDPKAVFPKRLDSLMSSYKVGGLHRGLTNIGLARLLYEKRNGTDETSAPDDRYAEKRENGRRALAKKISRFRRGEQFPQWDDLADLAGIFEKPIGFLIGETDCDTYELQDVADYLGLDGEAVQSIKRMTRTIGAKWLLEQSNHDDKNPEEREFRLVENMVAKTNAGPEACRAVLNRMLTAEAFKDLVLSLSDVGDAQYNLLMGRIANAELELRNSDEASSNHSESVMKQMEEKSRLRDAAARMQTAQNSVKASRYAAHECHVRLVDEMFSDIVQADADAVAKGAIEQRLSDSQE